MKKILFNVLKKDASLPSEKFINKIPDPCILSDSERRLLLIRIAGQLGLSNADTLPYVKGLMETCGK